MQFLCILIAASADKRKAGSWQSSWNQAPAQPSLCRHSGAKVTLDEQGHVIRPQSSTSSIATAKRRTSHQPDARISRSARVWQWPDAPSCRRGRNTKLTPPHAVRPRRQLLAEDAASGASADRRRSSRHLRGPVRARRCIFGTIDLLLAVACPKTIAAGWSEMLRRSNSWHCSPGRAQVRTALKSEPIAACVENHQHLANATA
jgi:hypothetical protein